MTLLSFAPSAFAVAAPAANAMQAYVKPAVLTLSALAGTACAFFLVNSAIQYMTSKGDPEKLAHAKKIFKNALIGFVLVLAAATLVSVLSHAYGSPSTAASDKLPTLQAIEPAKTDNGLVDVLINAVVGLLRNVVQSVAKPFLEALSYFLNSTPLMGDNSSVFNLWLAIVGITDVLFVLAVALLGFQVMSFSTFGFEELDIRQLLPQLALVFVLANTSIFVIDSIIGLSNAMIHALQSGFPSTDIWAVLGQITEKSSDLGVAGLLVMVAFLVLAVMLLVYYVGRLISLYLGAILSPLVLLLWLIPAFKDFAITALKTYLTTIFVLFVHVVILLLAASIFTGMLQGDNNGQPNTLMALIVGLATVVALLKTQGFMQELSYAASAPRAARELSGSFMRGVGYMNKTAALPVTITKKAIDAGKAIKRLRGRLDSNYNPSSPSGKPGKKPTIIRMDSSTPKSKPATPLKTGETRRAKKEPTPEK